MCILVILAIAQLFHQLGGCVAQMQGNRQVARLPHQFQGTVDPLVCRVALGAGGQIHRSFRQRDTPLRPSYLHHGIKSGVRQEQCVGIGQTDILGCRNDQSAGYESRVLSGLHHTRQPVERPVRITSADGLDKGGNDIIMHLPVLVIRQRILLQTLGHLLIRNHHGSGIRIRLHHQLQYVQQLAGIASRKAEHGIRLLQLYLLFFQYHVLCDGIMQQFQQILLLQ